MKECLPHCGAGNTLCKDTCIKDDSKNLVIYLNQDNVKENNPPPKKTPQNLFFKKVNTIGS